MIVDHRHDGLRPCSVGAPSFTSSAWDGTSIGVAEPDTEDPGMPPGLEPGSMVGGTLGAATLPEPEAGSRQGIGEGAPDMGDDATGADA